MSYFHWSIDPVLLHLEPLQLRWYGIFFVGSFFLGLALLKWIFKREGKDGEPLDNLLIYILIGAVIGARLMHCFAYEPAYFISHPLEVLKIYKGGLASHGGLLGSIVAIWLFCKRYKLDFLWLLSRTAIAGNITAASVRIGNFFNSEILGKPTDLPWAVVFDNIDNIPRHPVQIYEAIGYIAIFFLMLSVYKKTTPNRATKILPGVFLVAMFTIRFLLEYTKTKQADYSWSIPLSTGQVLSLPLIIIGLVWIVTALKSGKAETK